MADFEIAYGETEIREGGYVNDPADRGGETHRGVARKFHPKWPGWKIVDKYKADFPNDFVRRINDDQELVETVTLGSRNNDDMQMEWHAADRFAGGKSKIREG